MYLLNTPNKTIQYKYNTFLINNSNINTSNHGI